MVFITGKKQKSKDDSMEDLYRFVKSKGKDSLSKVITIIEGENPGDKAFVDNKGNYYGLGKEDFLSKHREVFLKQEETKTLEIHGNRVFCDVVSPGKKLVICGAGHVSIPIIRFGLMAEFSVTVIDDRLTFADHARNAGAEKVYCQDFQSALREIESDENTYFVIVTRGHRYDRICLEEIMEKANGYVGMIGSKKRVTKVKEDLLKEGYDQAKIENIYSPIGLDIKAETPVEIAIAIMGEIILVKNRKKTGIGYSKEILKGLGEMDEKNREGVLATIVSRKGSAPREVGTKMLIYPDGKTLGTIGGGCAESDVIGKARDLLLKKEKINALIPVDMTGLEAEEDGMVCGGVMEVFLEKISPRSPEI